MNVRGLAVQEAQEAADDEHDADQAEHREREGTDHRDEVPEGHRTHAGGVPASKDADALRAESETDGADEHVLQRSPGVHPVHASERCRPRISPPPLKAADGRDD
jgi:hypothetical protein